MKQASRRTYPREQIEIYGSSSWEPRRDLSMLLQLPNGLWVPSKLNQKRAPESECLVCGGSPLDNEYCEGCSATGKRYKGAARKLHDGMTRIDEENARKRYEAELDRIEAELRRCQPV